MSKRFRLMCSLVIPAMLLSFMAAPALAKGKGSGGKKPVGTVVSFDGTTLTMQAKDGSTLSAPVADDVQIKVDHRGRKGQDKTKKPSNGTVADIVAGASVLRIKVKCDEVVKLRLKAAAAPVAATTEDETATSEADATEEGASGCADDSDEAASDEAAEDEADADEDSEEELEDEEESSEEDEEEEDPSLIDEVVEELPLQP